MILDKLRYWIWIFISIAIMAGANLNANPGILTHADVEQYYKSEQKRVGVSAGGGFEGSGSWHNFWVGAKSLLGKTVDLKIAKEIREGTLHATITDSTLVGAINTDINASQEWETIKKKEYSATIPLDMLTESGREEIKQNLEEIGEVYKDISKRFESEEKFLSSKDDDYKQAFEQAKKSGLSKEEAEFILERLGYVEEERKESVAANNNEPNDPDNKAPLKVEVTEYNKVLTDNNKLLSEIFEGEENIPEEFKKKIYEGKYYVRDGSLGYEEGFESRSHEVLVKAAEKAGDLLGIASEFQDKYGKEFEAGLYAVTGLAAGFTAATSAFVKSKVGEEALGEYIAKGIDYSLEKVSTAIRAADPYLSSESARNLAAVAIFAAMTSSGAYAETKGLKYALSKKANNPVGSIKEQINNINYNKNSSGTGGTKNANNQNNTGNVTHNVNNLIVNNKINLPTDVSHHDKLGGHVKSRHVDITDADTLNRMNSFGEKKNFASKFYDEATANKVLKEAFNDPNFVKEFQNKIAKNPKKLDINFETKYNVGKGSTKNLYDKGFKQDLPIETNITKIVFKHDTVNGWHVETSYPDIAYTVKKDPLLESTMEKILKAKYSIK